jgi:hypothetical protein
MPLLLPHEGEGWDGGAFDFSMNVKSNPHLNLPLEGEDFKAKALQIRFSY